MRCFRGLAELPADLGSTAVTLGNFDGVHRGHQQVLRRLASTARTQGLTSVAITFDPHPALVHRPEHAPGQIMDLADRVRQIAATGVEVVLVISYTLEFAQQDPEKFVRSVLVDALAVRAVVIGHDVRFGRGNVGNLDTMRELGAVYGFEVEVIDEYGGDRRCSSTWVREALERGDVATAAEVLGRYHQLRGVVVHGAARGRELGFPTANLAANSAGLVPADGVYAGWLVDSGGIRWPAAISVGTNPTFEGAQRQVEAHVIDRPVEPVEDFNLYGQMVRLEFVSRLRAMVTFTGPGALIEQMNRDVNNVREILLSSGGPRTT